MRQCTNPEVNYSTIVCESLSKWKARHLVEDYRFDIYRQHTRLSLEFGRSLVDNGKIGLGCGTVDFDYDPESLSISWKKNDDARLTFHLSNDDDRLDMDDMIGFLNHPLGALVSITQDHFDKAVAFEAAGVSEEPHITIGSAALEALASHPDVSTFLLTRRETAMTLDIKLVPETCLPVWPDENGVRLMSFELAPDRIALSWSVGAGRAEERSWPAGEFECGWFDGGRLTDLLGIAFATVSGEHGRGDMGKSRNPVWRLVRGLELRLEGQRTTGHAPEA